MRRLATIPIILVGAILLITVTESCNEALCAPIVSKCLLMQSCNCDYKNCSCCKECYNCLSYQFIECCACIDMCPKIQDTRNTLSTVDDFIGTVPSLFNVLTESSDPGNGWLSFTFPIIYDITQFSTTKHGHKLHLQSSDAKGNSLPTPNCTVAFIAECMSENKCRKNCQSMGASGVRWFHNGCCECIGDTCINYGLAEPKCPNCSSFHVNSIDEYDEDEFVYDDGNENDVLAVDD